MSTSQPIFPHGVVHDLELRLQSLEAVLPGGQERSVKHLAQIPGKNVFVLYQPELHGWEEASVNFSLTLPPAALEDILPDGAAVERDALALVAVQCGASKLRRRVVLEKVASAEAEWRGSVVLARAELRGKVELVPLLVRSTDIPEERKTASGQRAARHRGLVLATGEKAELHIDEAPHPLHENSIEVEWTNFDTSTHPWLSRHAEDFYYLDLDGDRPKVVLNSKHAAFQNVMMSKHHRGATHALRETLNAQVAASIWLSLYTVALNSVVSADGEPPTMPTEEWKASVLRKVHVRAFRGKGEETALGEAYAFFRDPTQAGTLLARVVSAVQELCGVNDNLERYLESASEEES